MTHAYRYSAWDGSQDSAGLGADEVLENLTDDLMNFGDLQHAVRNLLQRGMKDPLGGRMQGLRDLLQQLRQQRRQMLDRYNLSSAIDDIRKQLDEILAEERETVERRLGEASDLLNQPGGEQEAPTAEGSLQPSGENTESETPASSGSGASGDNRQFAQMLKNIAEKKKDVLDALPQDTPNQIKELQNYEFMNPDAQAKFNELMEQLKKTLMDSFFKDLSQQISEMTPQQMERIKDMVRDLNQMLQQRMQGGEPDFDGFMEKYGDMFGEDPPKNLDELVQQMQQQIAQMRSLMDSLPGEMRQQLQDLMMDKIGDPDLQSELSDLASNLESLFPMRDMRNQYPFRGDEDVDLGEAMDLMGQMQSMDELERQIERPQYGGDIDEIDEEKLREALGDEAAETLKQLKQFLELLEEAGYIRKKGNNYELTPRGTRKIGQKALAEIYQQLKDDSFGKHQARDEGTGGERSDETKKYEFGDPFHLQLQKTIMNSLYRDGPQVPIRLIRDDFEVYRSESLTHTATVMMLDLSWSMALRGSFQAAKKVALALNNLIRSQFSRDSLYIIGFSAYARELKAEQLPYVRWDESVLGTNMHHALMLAQKLLARHTTGTRQIIIISDGVPTAHLERGRSYFAYPPSPITIRETLKEVKRCTQKEIVINTFMLDRNYYLKEFVNQVAKLNKGRVFYTTPDKLGQYILVDYVASKKKNVGG